MSDSLTGAEWDSYSISRGCPTSPVRTTCCPDHIQFRIDIELIDLYIYGDSSMYCPNIFSINLKTLLAASFIVTATAMPLGLSSTAVAQDRAQQAQSEGVTKDNKGGKSKVDAKKRYDEAVANMTEMVKNGEMTREQMEQRIDRMKKRMKAAAGNERTITKREYDEAVAKMKKMVENGEITREQMGQRLDRMKKMMKPEASITAREYKEAVAKMRKMVANGEITREQMQQRLDRMKKMMAREKTITREDIAEAKTKMQKMVEAGEISEEQMQQRLNEMRRTMRSQLGNQRDARAEYKRMEGRLMQAVEAGKMTQEEADQKLEAFGKELRAKAARAEEEAKNEMSDDCRELGMRLRQAVADGEMTGEEARAAWESECGGKGR